MSTQSARKASNRRIGTIRRWASGIALVLFAMVVTPAQAQDAPDVITNAPAVDASLLLADFGAVRALTLDSAGLPLMVSEIGPEQDVEFQREMNFARCVDPQCRGLRSVGLPSLAILDLRQQRQVDIVIGTDDRPWIYVADPQSESIEIIECLTSTCQTEGGELEAATHSADVSALFGTPGHMVEVEWSRGAPDEATTAHVLITDGASSALLHCDSPTCSSATAQFFDGEATSLVIDPNGNPAARIANRLIRCSDRTCTDPIETDLTAPGLVAFGDSGLPIVTINKSTVLDPIALRGAVAMLAHCDDPNCIDELDAAVPIIGSSVVGGASVSPPRTLHIGPTGAPVWQVDTFSGFASQISGSLGQSLPECATVHCSPTARLGVQVSRVSPAESAILAINPLSGTSTWLWDTAGIASDNMAPRNVLLLHCTSGDLGVVNVCAADGDDNQIADWLQPAPCEGLTITVDIGAGQLPTDGDDVILGTPLDDAIAAQGGDDIVCAGDGNDSVWGQAGLDELFGQAGNDRLRGGPGQDTLNGGGGADDVNGGSGNDFVRGQAGDDTAVRGGTGDDTVWGGRGNDLIVAGNGGEDTVYGGPGNDKVTGGPRPDLVFGGPGDDLLRGLGGADELFGNEGDDELFGGAQPDLLDGGAGDDFCSGGTQFDMLNNCEESTPELDLPG